MTNAQRISTRSTDLIGDHDRLLDHGLQNGYLFFPELLPPDTVLDLRRQVLCVARHDLLEPGTDLNAGIRKKKV